eukprot:TRINITY_DN8795_c0_g1_i1.p1 TRINITY_DN8795_c0_g1~~TRINITY_DN8795_c0_g1_i1.p1  ORF type:complete len:134 (-),score=8.19 TRINITY_DN8795_c0_g1_i1:127-528(-)
MFSAKNGILLSPPVCDEEKCESPAIRRVDNYNFRKLIRNYTESVRKFASKSSFNAPESRPLPLAKIELKNKCESKGKPSKGRDRVKLIARLLKERMTNFKSIPASKHKKRIVSYNTLSMDHTDIRSCLVKVHL